MSLPLQSVTMTVQVRAYSAWRVACCVCVARATAACASMQVQHVARAARECVKRPIVARNRLRRHRRRRNGHVPRCNVLRYALYVYSSVRATCAPAASCVESTWWRAADYWPPRRFACVYLRRVHVSYTTYVLVRVRACVTRHIRTRVCVCEPMTCASAYVYSFGGVRCVHTRDRRQARCSARARVRPSDHPSPPNLAVAVAGGWCATRRPLEPPPLGPPAPLTDRCQVGVRRTERQSFSPKRDA